MRRRRKREKAILYLIHANEIHLRGRFATSISINDETIDKMELNFLRKKNTISRQNVLLLMQSSHFFYCFKVLMHFDNNYLLLNVAFVSVCGHFTHSIDAHSPIVSIATINFRIQRRSSTSGTQ